MAEQVYKIDIVADVRDNTASGLAAVQARASGAEKATTSLTKSLNVLGHTKVAATVSVIDHGTAAIQRFNATASSAGRRGISVSLGILDAFTAPLRAFGRAMTSLPAMLGMGAVGAGSLQMGIHIPLSLDLDYENALIGFTQMLGKGQGEAQKFMGQLQDFADFTPFEFAPLRDTAATMLGSGFDQSKIVPYLTSIGDAASGLGTGTEGVKSITRAIVQMQAKGRIQGDELLQMMEARVPGLQLLADGFGMSTMAMQKMIEKGAVPAGKAIEVLTSQMTKRWGGMMDAQSKSLGGLLSTVHDVFSNKILLSWGQGIADSVRPRLAMLTGWFMSNKEGVANWQKSIQSAGFALGEFTMGGVERLRTTLSNMVNSPEWAAASTPLGKMKVVWKSVVEDPFAEWWNGSGKSVITGYATDIGGTLGSIYHGVLMGLLAGGEEGSVSNAGTTAGKSFFDAFMKEFKFDEVFGAAWGSVKGNQPQVLGGTHGGWGGAAVLGVEALLVSTIIGGFKPLWAFIAGIIGLVAKGKGVATAGAEVAPGVETGLAPGAAGLLPGLRGLLPALRGLGPYAATAAMVAMVLTGGVAAASEDTGAGHTARGKLWERTKDPWEQAKISMLSDEDAIKQWEDLQSSTKGLTKDFDDLGRSTLMVKEWKSLGLGPDALVPSHKPIGDSVAGDPVEEWIKQAIKAANAPAEWLAGLKTIAFNESTNRPGAVNPEAVNGEHATGLMQTMPSTFAAHAMAGHGDITNPVDNTIAAIDYIRGRYGSPDQTPGVMSVAAGGAWRPYARGGLIREHVVGVGLSSGAGYQFGERGTETVTPGTGGGGVTVSMGPGAVVVQVPLSSIDPDRVREFAALVADPVANAIARLAQSIVPNMVAG